MTIGERLRQARLNQGLTQEQLGRKIGYKSLLAQIYISKFESGSAPVPKKHMRKLSKILKVPIDEFLP